MIHSLLQSLLTNFPLTGDISIDVPAFLRHHGCPKTAEHVADVASVARQIANQFDADEDKAEIAGWLHDVSAVIPSAERAVFAREIGMDVLPEEVAFPMIVHQRLSAVFGREIFGIQDEAILSAVACHTTLKADASLLDKAVFIADKIAWDQSGRPPYIDYLRLALESSLDEGVMVYLQYLWDRRDTLRVVHPYFEAAYKQLSNAF